MQKYAKRIDGCTSLQVGDGIAVDFYKSIGMELMDVEQGYDGGWYPAGQCPDKPAPTLEAKAKEVRAQRDALLEETDYLLMPDYPISADDLEAVKAYRQALRDVPEQEGFPYTVVWPEKPSVVS